MKYFLFLFAAGLLGLAAFTCKTTTALSGKVTGNTGEALAGVAVRASVNNETKGETTSGRDGAYRLELAPGTYQIEFSHPGFEGRRVTEAPVVKDQATTLNIVLNSGAVLDEVVVTSYGTVQREAVALTADDVALTAPHATSKSEDRGMAAYPYPARSKASPAAGKPTPMPTMGAAPADMRKVVAKDAVYTREEAPAELAYETAAPDAFGEPAPREMPLPHPGGPAQPSPRAGLLTAGEWNDLHNWSHHWTDLLADGEIDAYQKMYQFYPKNRYTLLLQNEQELPVTDAAVQLLDKKGNPVWEARTDNLGRAELWSGLNGETVSGELNIAAWVDGKKHDLGRAKPAAEGLNRHKIQRECQHAKNVDIVWAVDATGSMGDEIEYLKTELLDVIGRVKSANPELAVRMGSVFYRDKGDDDLAKSSALNYDIAKTVDYIRKQSAGGGGDYPEAVHSALDEAIYRQPWSRDAVARICFLVLDASPHQEPEVIASLHKSIREAAKKGVRIVPVSASGIQKDTEFLMKFFGLATNGSYVFLTDHSGIGGKHLEPTTDEYKVELLNDLLVRLITEYTAVPTCDGKSSIRFEDSQAQNGQQQGNGQTSGTIQYYPNPVSAQFTLDLPFDADKVTLYDAEGKAVRTYAQLTSGTHKVPVNDLPDGFYTLRIWKGTQVQSGKVVVVRA